MSNDTEIRLIRLLDGSSGLTAQQIADRLGIHRQSVYRVMNRCDELGVAIVRENGRFRLASKDRDFARIQFSLDGQQAHDLVAAVKSVRALTPFAQEALDIVRKTLVGDKLELESVVYYHSYDEINPAVYRTVIGAIRERRALELSYRPTQSGRSQSQHTFDPFRIVFWNGHYYLVGRSRNYAHKPGNGVMHLRLDRIAEAKIAVRIKNGDTIPSVLTFSETHFDPKDYMERFFGTFGGQGEPEEIVLHFPKTVAKAAAEVQRHPSRELQPQPDDSLIYKLRVPISSEIVWWVASWAGVRVLAPEHLREKVREHCLEVARLNSPDAATTVMQAEFEEV